MMSDRYTNQVYAMFGYKRNNHYSGLLKGDEVIIYNDHGTPVAQDLIEEITPEAIRVGGEWYYDFEYSVRKLEE
jgi:hypothetical protein